MVKEQVQNTAAISYAKLAPSPKIQKYCCNKLEKHIKQTQFIIEQNGWDTDRKFHFYVEYAKSMRGYGISDEIFNCPWCGKKLSSLK